MSALTNSVCETVALESVAEAFEKRMSRFARRVILCAGTGCVAGGAIKVRDALAAAMRDAGLAVCTTPAEADAMPDDDAVAVYLSKSGCQGFCQMGPLVTIEPEGLLYVKVRPGDAEEIVRTTLVEGKPIDRLLYVDPNTGKHCNGPADIPFYKRQSRTVLEACGYLDPEDIDGYIARGGYRSARIAFTKMSPEAVCEEILASGLRGRGGGGFPTGRKWQLTLKEPGPKKYIVCNGDEGDPGAFMDRSVMEGNPHSVIEGMLVAGRAVGADEGIVYVRAEYPLAVRRMRQAAIDAEGSGLLGDRLFGTEFGFKVQVMEGAGAFVCGEETALLASVMGRRGMPMPKPPFPAQSGLYGKPTVINNVETLASVPLIIAKGAQAFRGIGTENSPGTKTFALTGHVCNTGLIEVPFGTTLREIVYNIGGGVIDDAGRPTNEPFKAVQIGGPSGGCLTEEHLDLPLDYDSLRGVGAMVGSGGLVVMNRKTCMVKIARFFMQFTQNESCGKCVLCREGTKQMLALLDDITEGRASLETLDLLEDLARVVGKGSLCGLGKTAPNPVLSTLRYFRAEYEAHVVQKRCPAGQCKALSVPEILIDKCIGCTACVRKCPVGAITGERKQPHRIDPAKCIKCGACATACKFGAVVGV
jgi:NADH-quinone oxidoreductase subunit F